MSWHLAAAFGLVMSVGLAAAPEQRRVRQPVSAQLGRPFTLAAGAHVKLTDVPVEIGFTRVVMDSRCPKGAECITGGLAVVALWVSHGGARSARELRTHPPASSHIVYGPYTITLEQLEPAPQLGRRIAPRYVARFVVRRS